MLLQRKSFSCRFSFPDFFWHVWLCVKSIKRVGTKLRLYPQLYAAKTTTKYSRIAVHAGIDGYYDIDWEVFEKSCDTNTRLFILSNPHNPVGRVFHQDELLKMAEICLRKGITICSDEIHCDLIFPGYKHIPIASLDKNLPKHDYAHVDSKTFNHGGLKCSNAIIQNADLRQLKTSSPWNDQPRRTSWDWWLLAANREGADG
jgi:cystathionine beta-lyase